MGSPLNNKVKNFFQKKVVKTSFQTVATDVCGSRDLPVPDPVTLSQRTDMVLKGLCLVCKHHGASEEVLQDLEEQLHSYLDDSPSEKVWLKRIKYVLTYFMAKYLRNKPPTQPDKPFAFTGKIRGWVRARCNARNRKNTHLWYSWLQCKRCTIPLSEDFVQTSYQEHCDTLKADDPCTEDVLGQVMNDSTFNSLLEDIADRVQVDDFYMSQPSNGASFESTRSKGGQNEHLRSLLLPDYRHGKKERIPFIAFTTELWSMKHYEVVNTSFGFFYNQTVENRSSIGWEYWNQINYNDSLNFLIFTSLVKQRLPFCTIQAILEPNKCRVISKEESLLQYYNIALQKSLHSIMRKIPCFRLIGRELCPTDLIDLTEHVRPTDKWFSIDYSAATDGLSAKYSSAVLERIIKNLSLERQAMARYSLGPHELHYPIPDSPHIEWKGTMRNGQLMGGILSFIVLCLCNLGLYLWVTREEQKFWSYEDRINSVLVNGDDMVYAADPALWDDHCRKGELLGLKMSDGKAYIDDTYININSASFHYPIKEIYLDYEIDDYDQYEHWFDCPRLEFLIEEDIYCPLKRVRSNLTPYYIPFLNTGLFYGIHKVQDLSGESSISYQIEDFREFSHILTYREYVSLCYSRSPCQTDYHRRIVNETEFWQTRDLSSRTCHTLLRKAEINSTESYKGITDCIDLIVQGSLPGKQSDILSMLIDEHSALLARECLGFFIGSKGPTLFIRNLFIPKDLGGMGVSKPHDFKTKISPIQKKVYCSIMRLREKRYSVLNSQLPLFGFPLERPVPSFPWERRDPEPNIYQVCSTRGASKSKHEILSDRGIPSDPCPYVLDL